MNSEFWYEIIRNTAIKMVGMSSEEAANFANEAIKEGKTINPDIDADTSNEHEGEQLLPLLGQASARELDKFVSYAKEQGTKMPFDLMEKGILAAGRKDMQNGLTEVLNSLKFEKPVCPECDEGMDDRGLSKKKF